MNEFDTLVSRLRKIIEDAKEELDLRCDDYTDVEIGYRVAQRDMISLLKWAIDAR